MNSLGPGVTFSERGDSIVYHIPTPTGEYNYMFNNSNINSGTCIYPSIFNGNWSDGQILTFNSSNPLTYVVYDGKNTNTRVFPVTHLNNDVIYAYCEADSYGSSNVFQSKSILLNLATADLYIVVWSI